MSSIRLRFTGLVAALFAGGILVLVLAGAFLIEPWFAWRSRAPFESVLADLSALPSSAPGGEADLAAITGQAKTRAAGTAFKISVVDRDGMVVASSAPEFNAGQRLPLPREEGEFVGARRLRLDRGERFYGILAAPAPGQSVIHLVAGLRPGLYLVVSQPLEPLRKAMAMASGFFVLFGVLILGLVLANVLFLSGREVRPVLELSGLALRIAEGDLGARWAGKRDDEIGILGSSIDRMAERLTRTIAELELKVRAQEDFLAAASHELKTPIGLVRGYAEALALGYWNTEAERDELASVIMKESDRLASLVRDLSFVSMGQGGGISLLRADEDLVAVAREAAGRFEREAASKGAALSFEAEGPLMASLDRYRMTQALDNLLSNAVRYVPSGGSVAVSVGRLGGSAVVAVSNSGERIPEEALPRLFEPFFRIDSSRNRETGGSGLGLALVRRVAEAHGGSCGIENTASGVRAWIGVPALEARP
jgi:signal transduction histidine kinase